MAAGGTRTVYKIQLTSGRVLGPLTLEKVAKFIVKRHITGLELAREYPLGDWVPITQIPPLAELWLQHLSHPNQKDLALPLENAATTVMLPPSTPALPASLPTPLMSSMEDSPLDSVEDGKVSVGFGKPPEEEEKEFADLEEGLPEGLPESPKDNLPLKTVESPVQSLSQHEDFQFGQSDEGGQAPSIQPQEAAVGELTEIAEPKAARLDLEAGLSGVDAAPLEASPWNLQGTFQAASPEIRESSGVQKYPSQSENLIVHPLDGVSGFTPLQQQQETQMLQVSRSKKIVEWFKIIVGALVLGTVGYALFLEDPPKKQLKRPAVIKPELPLSVDGKADPSKSITAYQEAMKFYVQDTLLGYQIAAEKLLVSASYDMSNVKALAMLASSYLNLIDISNKNEDYFAVISKLIDLSRAKNLDLPETIIADVEFFITANRAEAAQNRIIEYTKSHQSFGIEMFYYLAFSFFHRGDAKSAAQYLVQFPDQKAFGPKVFYLKGLVAEKLEDDESAMNEYLKAIQWNPNHARSHLKIATLLKKKGSLQAAAGHLNVLMQQPQLLPPKELALAYYLHAQLSEVNQEFQIAVGDMNRAVQLDPDNHDLLLELYTLMGREAGGLSDQVKQAAKMYYFLGVGERLLSQGAYEQALTPLLQARQANDLSALPLVKIGDLFNYLHDIENARKNYKLAADRAGQDIHVWSKYIQSLIQSYEWDEATKAMERFRQLPVSQSTLDKAVADIYQKKGQFKEALVYYKKAMSREVIEPTVYGAYAKSLISAKNFKDPPFFFALALRYDPLNMDAMIGTAKCLSETESIDRGIQFLEDQMQHSTGSQSKLLTGIAELQTKKGDWENAQRTVNHAMQVDPSDAEPWRIQAMVALNRENIDKKSLDRALAAYQSFLDRNPSDPLVYFERYQLFVKKTEFDRAKEELGKLYVLYPKYPNLHYYLGALYSMQGNHKAAAEEFKMELQNTPNSFLTLLAYGKELQELGDPQEALKYFTRSMQINPQSSDAKMAAGWANYRLKNFIAAVSLLNEASYLDSANPVIYKRMGIVQRDMGDLSNACVAFRKYLEMEPDAEDKNDFKACL